MTFALGPRAAKSGYRLASFDTLDSTNAEAMRRAREGEAGPLWIATLTQSAGRGRRGRIWHGTEGDLAASLLLTMDVAPATAATLGFVAGIALHEALHQRAPAVAFSLKWPNDLLADGRKLAGILLESETVQGRLAVVVGVGVNIVSEPDRVAFPATSLAQCDVRIGAEELLLQLSDCWIDAFDLWERGRGMPRIRDRWLAHAAGHGDAISVRSGERAISGVFETLDERGGLILRKSDGTPLTIAAGEVYFGNAATEPEIH